MLIVFGCKYWRLHTNMRKNYENIEPFQILIISSGKLINLMRGKMLTYKYP